MKFMLKIAVLAASVAAAPLMAAAPAAAPAAAAATNVAVVNLDAAVVQSAAFKSAATQIQTTYKTQITAFQTRQTAIQTELTPARNEIEALQRNPATPKATLEAKVNAFQSRAQAAQAELQRLTLPFARPEAYAKEQIGAKIEAALKAAMTAKGVNLVVSPEAVIAAQGNADLTPDVISQLNALVPSVSITPPANWQPGQAQGQGADGPSGR
jgi:Skp family chaperone for outer membrane proteins